MDNYLFYVKPSTAKAQGGDKFRHIASEQFKRVGQDDVVWMVTMDEGRLTLLLRFHVGANVDREVAQRRLGGTDLWEAKYHLLSRGLESIQARRIDINSVARKLRFVGENDRLPTAFTGQHFQALRRLTPESAALLGGLWAPKTPSIQKNPTWVSDELILALDLYFRLERKAKDQHHPEVVALSELLNRLPIHTERPDAARFRNPSGVALKLANFLALDPQHTSVGMRRGGRQDRVIWDEFANDRERLRMLAEVIRGAHQSTGSSQPAEDEDEREFPEGRVVFRLHRSRERSAALVRRKKKAMLVKTGALMCEVCGFSFRNTYGKVGEGFIECHHVKPVSALTSNAKTTLADLVVVCSNCHRMLHRRRPWLSAEALQDLLPGKSG